MSLQHMQIGEVADRTGLSLRTIRYYEEVGLVRPSARTPGGFRLYTEPDVARLNLVKRMKPLGFSIEQTRELLLVLDALDGDPNAATPPDRLVDQLAEYQTRAEQRCTALREELDLAETFASDLRTEISRLRRRSEAVR